MSETEQTYQDDEIDLSALFQTLWRQRGLIVAITLVCLLAVGGANIALMALPKSQTITASISFNFQGAEKGKYPDGSPFSQQELTSNDVLQQAITKSQVDISADDLQANLSLVPGEDASQAIEDQLNGILASASDSKKAPPEAVLENTSKVLQKVQGMVGKSATLSLDIGQLKLNENKGMVLLRNILQAWADKAAKQYGVLTANLSLPQQPLEWDKTLSVPSNADALAQYLRQISSAISQLNKIPGIEGITASGTSINDLESNRKLLTDSLAKPLQHFVYDNYWAFSSNDKVAEIQVRSRLKVLQAEIQSRQKLIVDYENVLNPASSLPLAGDANAPQQPVSASAPMDSSFLNQMLELGSKVKDTEFRQSIIQKRIDEMENLAGLEEELSLLSGTNTSGQDTPHPEQAIKDAQAYVQEQAPVAITRVNKLQKQTLALLTVASERAFGIDSDLFSYIRPPKMTTTGGIVSNRIALQFALASALGIILGCLVAIIRGGFATKSKEF